MTKAQHTPGPWNCDQTVGFATFVGAEENPNIAAVHFKDTDEGKANARLIAAAPELYEALCDMISDRDCLSEATVDFAQRAIAKARGQS